MRHSTSLALFAALIALAALLVYLPGLSGPLFFDDKPALTANELVKIDGSAFDEWRAAAFSSHSGVLRRPIAMLSFAANHALVGDFSPAAVKAVNLAIHLAIAGLLYGLSLALLSFLRLGREPSVRQLTALVAAGIWLLHPLHVSTVLYSVQRMAQLSTFFVLAGLLLFTLYRRRWAEVGATTGEVLAAALWLLLLTALAALSKENGVLLPWLIVVLEVCVFRGVWAGTSVRWLRAGGWLALATPVVLILLLLGLAPEFITGGYAWREFTLEQRVLTQARLLWSYLGWFWLPNINAMAFQHDDIPLSMGLLAPVSTLVCVVAWPLALLAAFVLRLRYPLLLLALLFYLVAHSMESTVYPLEMVYEHRNYLATVFMSLVIAALLVIPASSSRRVKVAYPVLAVLAVLCLLLLVRVQSWSDEFRLAYTEASNHPDSPRSNFFYANALLQRYEDGAAQGLNEEETRGALLLSRHYFERMYQNDNNNLGALVMLYYLDSLFFPVLREQVNWWQKLEVALANRTLQASDWNALNTLVECLASGICEASRGQVLAQFDALAGRYPQSARVLRLRYLYLSGQGAEPAELLPLLQRAQELAPRADWAYAYLVNEYDRAGDVAQMYEVTRLWLLNDRQRYQLPRIKSLFRTAPIDQGGSP